MGSEAGAGAARRTPASSGIAAFLLCGDGASAGRRTRPRHQHPLPAATAAGAHQHRLGALAHRRQVGDVEEAVDGAHGGHRGVGVVRKPRCHRGDGMQQQGGVVRPRGRREGGRRAAPAPAAAVPPTAPGAGLGAPQAPTGAAGACQGPCAPATAAGLPGCHTTCSLTMRCSRASMPRSAGCAPKTASAAARARASPTQSHARPAIVAASTGPVPRSGGSRQCREAVGDAWGRSESPPSPTCRSPKKTCAWSPCSATIVHQAVASH